MSILSFNKLLLAGLLSSSLLITGCGGGGGGSSSSGNGVEQGGDTGGGSGGDTGGGSGGDTGGGSGGDTGGGSGGDTGGGSGGDTGGGTEPSEYSGVEGPLDALQDPLSNQVFSALSEGAAGTPLEASIDCLGQVVAEDIIDILDAFAAVADPASADDPQGAFETAAANAQLAASELSVDLPNTLASLAGQGDCSVSAGSGSGDGNGNPLAGTPLAPLGDALAAAFANGGDPSQLDPSQLAVLFASLSAAFSEGTSNLPAEVTEAPILSGALQTIETALSDLAFVALAAGNSDGAAVSATTATTVDNLLKNVLIDVLPVGFLEEQSGQGGIISEPIEAGVTELTTQLDAGLTQALVPLFDGVGTLLDAISGGMAGGDSGAGTGPTGTPLDAILAPLADAAAGLQAGDGGDGPTGTPLDLLLGPIAGALAGGEGSCPLAGTPLEPACEAVDGILGGLLGGLGL